MTMNENSEGGGALEGSPGLGGFIETAFTKDEVDASIQAESDDAKDKDACAFLHTSSDD